MMNLTGSLQNPSGFRQCGFFMVSASVQRNDACRKWEIFMTKFNITTVVASAMIAGTLMAGVSYAASAVIEPSIKCGSNSASSANCGDTQGQNGGYTVKSLAGTGDHDDGGHENENDGDDD
jgi:hypothetical protein